jgi:hypothetical protein
MKVYFKTKFGDLKKTAESVGFSPLSTLQAASSATASKTSANPFVAAATLLGMAGPAPQVDGMNGEMENLMKLYSLARAVDPYQYESLNVKPFHIDVLASLLPKLGRDVELQEGLKKELSDYLSLSRSRPEQKNVQLWWAANKEKLPSWATLARILFLLPTSAAAVERVFSVMRNTFGPRAERSLGDYVRASCMLQYNYRDTSASAQDRRAKLVKQKEAEAPAQPAKN